MIKMEWIYEQAEALPGDMRGLTWWCERTYLGRSRVSILDIPRKRGSMPLIEAHLKRGTSPRILEIFISRQYEERCSWKVLGCSRVSEDEQIRQRGLGFRTRRVDAWIIRA